MGSVVHRFNINTMLRSVILIVCFLAMARACITRIRCSMCSNCQPDKNAETCATCRACEGGTGGTQCTLCSGNGKPENTKCICNMKWTPPGKGKRKRSAEG